jgi:LSD1 subclass zinc finger protein
MSCSCFKRKTKVDIREEILSPRPKSILKNNKKKKNNRRKEIQENRQLIDERARKKEEFTEFFLSEVIECGGCNDQFTLKSGRLKIHCSSCNHFMCCNIAGACIGPDCSVVVDGEKQSLKYCMSCVNPYLKINIMDNGQALCKNCETLPGIPDIYLEV